MTGYITGYDHEKQWHINIIIRTTFPDKTNFLENI